MSVCRYSTAYVCLFPLLLIVDNQQYHLSSPGLSSNESAKKRKMQDYLSPRTTPGAQSSTKCALATEEKVRRD